MRAGRGGDRCSKVEAAALVSAPTRRRPAAAPVVAVPPAPWSVDAPALQAALRLRCAANRVRGQPCNALRARSAARTPAP
jgi:hypothetical protein